MSDLQLDNDGDLLIEDGDLVMSLGIDEIDQLLRQRLKFFSAEWFLDTEAGIPYFDEVFVKNPDPVTLNTIFKDIILSSPGVIGLDEFDLKIDTVLRELRLAFRARTTEDIDITFNETLG